MTRRFGHFDTKVSGIPCQVMVTGYSKGTNFPINSASLEPNDPEEFEFRLLDRKGYLAPWLEDKLKESDYGRLLQEYLEVKSWYQ